MFPFAIALLIAAPVELSLQPGSRLWIDGDSNRSKWSCEASRLEGFARAESGDADVPAAVVLTRFAVPVASLRCNDEHMDEKLRDALKAQLHPRIVYELLRAEALPGAQAGEHLLNATGILTVGGRSQYVTTVIRAGASRDGSLFARGSIPIDMSSYGIDPPTAFLGLVKCKDRIVVRFELKARAQAVERRSASSFPNAAGAEERASTYYRLFPPFTGYSASVDRFAAERAVPSAALPS